MDASFVNIESMTEDELRELIQESEKALDRIIAKRAGSTLKEARRMAAEVGFEAVFTKAGKTDGGKTKAQVSRAKVLPKYRNPEHPDETWSGRGRQPRWVQTALAAGETLADLTIPVAGAVVSD